MGELQVGDYVFDENGKPVRISHTTIPALSNVYNIRFTDNVEILADGEHLWRVQDHNQRKNLYRRGYQKDTDYSVKSTKEMLDSGLQLNFNKSRAKNKYSIDLCGSVEFEEKDLPIPPYTFGAWLGDGSSGSPLIHVADEKIVKIIKREGVQVGDGKIFENQGKAKTYYLGDPTHIRDQSTGQYRGNKNNIYGKLKSLDVLWNKHIPEIYLTASKEQRLALLRGLMDTNGYYGHRAEFCSMNKRLAEDVLHLCKSFGIKAKLHIGRATINGKDCGEKYRICFTTTIKVFNLERKYKRQQKETRPDTLRRYIESIEPAGKKICKCITVESENGCYLAGKDFIVTHNTVFGPKWLLREIYHPDIGRGRGDYLAVTATFDLFKIKMLPAIMDVFKNIYNVGKYWSGDKIIELRDPYTGEFWAKKSSDKMWGRVILRSADSSGGLEAATAKAVWADEIGQDRFSKKSYQAIRRRIAVEQGRTLMTTTLYEPGWFLYDIVRKAKKNTKEITVENDRGELTYSHNKKNGMFLIQFDSTINPSFSKEEFLANKEDLDNEDFAMFYKGREGASKFLVYSAYNPDKHLTKRFAIPPLWKRYIGIDYGGAHTCAVFFSEDPVSNILYCYNTYLEGQYDIKEHVKKILQLCGGRPDLASGGSPSENQWRREFGQYGLFVVRPSIKDVEVGIDRVNRTHRKNGIIYFDDLTGIIGQKEIYRRVKNDETGTPTKDIKNKNDFHYMDAERYIISEIRPLGVNKVKVMKL
jgi:hypothetical protein